MTAQLMRRQPDHTFSPHIILALTLLCLGWVHVPLWTNDQLSSMHSTLAPDLGIVSVVANDHRNLHALRALGDRAAEVSRSPSFNGSPRQDLSVLLHNLTLIVDEHKRIVGILLRMLLVLFARQRENAPDASFFASLPKHVCQSARDLTGSVKHLLTIVHDTHGRVLGEDDEIHTREADLGALDDLADLLGVLDDFFVGVQTRHRILEDTYSDRVWKRAVSRRVL